MASGTIHIDEYDVYLRQILGRGAFGVVYKGKNRNNDKEIAVKNITYKEAGEESNETLKIMGTNELEIFHLLNNHKNIVKLLHQHDDGEAIWIFMEYCDLRDLSYYLKSTMPQLDQKLKIMYECISAISYMHSFSPPIIHRDIKPQNVLMMKVKDKHVAKITDFGIGKLLESSSGALQATMTTLAGTASYMAPEFSTGGYLGYKPSVDVFSLGLLFHILLQYDRSNNSLVPMSTEVVKSNKMCNFGQEMSYAVQNNLPLPMLFETPPADSNSTVHEVQRIITDMVKYHESERLKPLLVKDKIMEVYSAYMQRRVTELEQKYMDRPLCEEVGEDLDNTVADLREDNKRLQQELSTKEQLYQNKIKENEKLLEELAEARLEKEQGIQESKTAAKQATGGIFSKMPKLKMFHRSHDKVKEEAEARCHGNILLDDLEVKKENIKLVKLISKDDTAELWQVAITKHGKKIPMMGTVVNVKIDKQKLLQKANVFRKINHEKIVQLLGLCSSSEPIYIITELMNNGTLLDNLRRDEGQTLKFDVLIDIAAQIAEGMDYLGANCCIHRDLRCVNIFLSENNIIKIFLPLFTAGFISKVSEVYYADEGFKFAVKWTAPEAAFERKFSIKSDVWSYGILLWELFTYGEIPYLGMTGEEVLNRLDSGYRMPRPTGSAIECPQSIYEEVMLKCWDGKPQNRPTCSFCNTFFKDYVCEPKYVNQKAFSES